MEEIVKSMQSLNEMVTDNTPQQRELNPLEALEAKEEEDAELQYLIEQATPNEKADIFFNAARGAA